MAVVSNRERIYDFICAFIADRGYSPSYREIGDGVGIKSASTVSFHLRKLADEGRIGYVRDSPRTIHLNEKE